MWQAVLTLAILGFVFVIARQVFSGPSTGSKTGPTGFGRRRSRFKCRTCKSCGKLFDDGVLCQFQGRETFKNETHIRNCIDYERR